MILFTQYFSADENRQEEIDLCLQTNLENPIIGKVCLLTEQHMTINNQKIEQIVIGERIKYKHAFDIAKDFAGEICILSNSDIYFDHTLNLLTPDFMKGKFLALSRWDETPDAYVIRANARCSQDSWIFLPPLPEMFADIQMGYPGCDNRMAYEANKAGLKVLNPSLEIISRHVHNTPRHYSEADRIHGGYLEVSASICFGTESPPRVIPKQQPS